MASVRSFQVDNFYACPAWRMDFSPNINLFVADDVSNGSSLIKLLYGLLSVTAERTTSPQLNKLSLQKAYADKLSAIFRPDALGRLVGVRGDRTRLRVELDSGSSIDINFAKQASIKTIIADYPKTYNPTPIFIPSVDLSTMTSWLSDSYDSSVMLVDESWVDTCKLMRSPMLRPSKLGTAKDMIEVIEHAVGGEITMNEFSGRFYIGKTEASLMPEGARKLMSIAQLIRTGHLLGPCYLFWDMPESNLSKNLIKTTAKIMHELSQQGVQLFVVTQCTSLVRELENLSSGVEQLQYFFVDTDRLDKR